MAKATGEKICFVIAPIGADGSDIRLRSDQVLKHIIGPSAEACGYTTLRADHISEPGIITSQVIQHIVEDPLVVADLTGWNPNVFYEIALRHAMKKPIVQIINATEKIPFDVAASRTVHVDHRDLDSVARAKEDIVKQIKSVEKNPEEVDNPISVAMELQSLKRSDNPLEKSYAEIITMLAEIRAGMGDLREGVRRGPMHPGILEDLLMGYDRLYHAMSFDPTKPVDPDSFSRLRHALDRLSKPLEILCMENGMPPDMVRRIRRRREFDDLK